MLDMTDQRISDASERATEWRGVMVVLAIFFALVFSQGCSPSAMATQAIVANSVAVGVNRAKPALMKAYEDGGNGIIDRWQQCVDSGQCGDIDAARAGALRDIEAYEAKWSPYWKAFEVFAAAHNAWAEAIESKDEPATEQAYAIVVQSYCRLVKLAPENAPKILTTLETVACPK
jgi:hypothetical protein